MNKIISLILVLFCIAGSARAQLAPSDSNAVKSKSVLIFKDPRIDYLQRIYSIRKNEKRELKKVFRVQVVATTSREVVNKAKADFASKFPGVVVYLSFDPPTFKLRVGNFATRQDAQSFLKEVKAHFPASFIVEQ